MLRSLTFVVVCAGVLAYYVLLRGGSSQSGSFHAGNLYGAYEIHSQGRLPERLGYLVLSEAWPDIEYEGPTGGSLPGHQGPFRFAYRYQGGVRVSSLVQPGQTVWIGADRKAFVIPTVLSPAEIRLLQERGAEIAQHVSSPQEVRERVGKLKAEPGAPPNAAPPHR